MDRADARELWMRFEPVHAVVYFAPECRAALTAAGYRGFWMGYFAGRAAPLGVVGPDVVGAAFYNFEPVMVRRALPDAWTFAPPRAALEARSRSSVAVLRSLGEHVDAVAERVAPLLARVVSETEGAGRPLYAANRDLPLDDDPVAALWQSATSLREHRGDAHVAALLGAGLDGLEAHVLALAVSGAPVETIAPSRGWSEEAWEDARARLVTRGLLEGSGANGHGQALHASVEASTDAQAAPIWDVLTDQEVGTVISGLGSLARGVIGAGIIGFPNPIGFPALGAEPQ